MCGHATVAGVHALVESGRLPFPDDAASVAVAIHTRSGLLTAFVEQQRMKLPGKEYIPCYRIVK